MFEAIIWNIKEIWNLCAIRSTIGMFVPIDQSYESRNQYYFYNHKCDTLVLGDFISLSSNDSFSKWQNFSTITAITQSPVMLVIVLILSLNDQGKTEY